MSDPWLEGPLARAAYGWRLERRDGVALGFTSHDRNVEVDGIMLFASPGMMPSTITESLGTDIEGLDVRGALTADAIRPDDLRSGKWDGASLQIFMFDWSNPGAGKRILAAGELGAISHGGNLFEAEFKGPASKLDRPVAPYTSPGCRAHFCGSECGLNAARFKHIVTAASVSGSTVMMSSRLPGTVDRFAFGKLRWLEGPNTGLSSDILTNDSINVQLLNPPPFGVDPGCMVELFEGCDKSMATCASRFGNAINFRGEPYLPGNDVLTRYPGAS